jgi:acyl carrier protein
MICDPDTLPRRLPVSISIPPLADDDILAIVSEQLTQSGVAAVVGVDTNLWESGMDSLVSVTVMVGVESAFDIEFPDEFLTRENFTSVGNIAAAVRQILAGRIG